MKNQRRSDKRKARLVRKRQRKKRPVPGGGERAVSRMQNEYGKRTADERTPGRRYSTESVQRVGQGCFLSRKSLQVSIPRPAVPLLRVKSKNGKAA